MGLVELDKELKNIDRDKFLKAYVGASHLITDHEEFTTKWEQVAEEWPFADDFVRTSVMAEVLHGRTEDDAWRYVASSMCAFIALKNLIDADALERSIEG